MPIYEYACQECREVFEEIVIRRSDEGEVRCPACSSRTVARIMSRPAESRSGGTSSGGGCGPVG